MSKLDEVLKALNKMLGNSAVQRASELVKSVEVLLNEDENHGEHIPPQNQTAKPRPDPRKKTAAPSFFAHDRGVSGGYTPPKPVDPLSQPRYQPIDVRRNAEPLFRREYRELRRAGENYSLYRSAPSELAKRFYAQARLVQRYADQYEQSEPCVNLYVSYMDLSVRQFRTYVTMHPQLLRGDYSRITPDGWSYLALYFSELLCGAAKAELPDEERLAELTDIAAYAGGLAV